MNSRILTILTLLCLPLADVSALEVGDKAPALKIDTWISGPACDPSKPDGKTIYIVEFWATWCPPCKQTIPFLNRLYDRLRETNVVLVSVTYEDEALVRSFVQRMDMKYRVAIDPSRQSTASYMGENRGIPYAFVVDKDGIVLWKGHPLAGLDRVIDQVLAGSFDPKMAARKEKIEEQLQKTLASRDYEKALALTDELIAIDDKVIDYYQLKISLLTETGKSQGIKPIYKIMLSVFSDSAEDLNALAWQACTVPLELRDLTVAQDAIHKAVGLSNRKDASILNTLARLQYALGLLDSAITAQKEALGLSRDAQEKEAFEETLRYYQTAIELRREEMKAHKGSK